MGVVIPRKASLLALAVSLTLADAHAIGLGEPEVHSYIGSPLRLDIPVHLSRGEAIDAHCVSLQAGSTGAPEGSPALALLLKVVGGERPRLQIESERVAREPYASLRVRIDCGGVALSRDFAVLLDPPPQSLVSSSMAGEADAIEVPSTGTRAPAAGQATGTTPGIPAGASGSGTPGRPHRASAPTRTARATPAPSARLRLETGGLLPRPFTASGGEGSPVLRLDMHMDAPATVTASLVSQRAQLRDLRALMLSGDDTLERLLSLQTQVGSLETQLKALQGGAAAAGAPAPVLAGMQAPIGAGASAPAAPPAAAGGTLPSPAAVAEGPGAPGAQPSAQVSAPAAEAGPAPAPAGAPPQVKVIVHKQPVPPPPADDFDWTLPAAAGGVALLGIGGLAWLRQRRLRGLAAEQVEIPADEMAFADAGGSAGKHRPEGLPTRRAGKGEGAAASTGPDQSAEQAARSAYLAQRFPEIAAGLIQLDDPDSVVNGARLYVETGDHDRAAELLEGAINDRPGNDIRPWLGLFEVLRLRRQVDEYVGLLARFRERFDNSRYLPEVLAVGRQLDPTRPEFAAAPGAVAVEIGPDGTNWLNPELDFVPQALAQDLHDTLMAELSDDDFTLSPVEERRT